MKINKIFMFILLFLGMIVNINAVDLDNIQFDNQEFYGGAVTATKVLELNNGKLAVGYIKSSDNYVYLKICDLDGTNCGSELIYDVSAQTVDMFYEENENRIYIITGRVGAGNYKWYDLDTLSWGAYNVFSSTGTNYVSAVQTNSTDFAITYQDDGDNGRPKLILCKLNGSSCGSVLTLAGDSTSGSYGKLIKLSNNKIALVYNSGYSTRLQLELYNNDLTNRIINVYNSGSLTSYIDMIEGSDNKLKIVYRDDGNSNYGTFRSCDLDGTNCGAEIVYQSNTASYNKINEFNNLLFVSFTDQQPYGQVLNMNLIGGEISSFSMFTQNLASNLISSIITSNKQLITSYHDAVNSNGMFAISELLVSGAEITFNSPIANSYINSTDFLLNVSYSLNASSSYKLNNGSTITLSALSDNEVRTITGIEGLNTIQVFTNAEGELTNSSINFTIDTIAPTINNNIEVEYNTYSIDGFNSSCTDINLDYCYIVLNSQNVSLNTTSFNFTLNGNISYTIYSGDLAGNTATDSGTTLINPYVYLYFFNSVTAANISDYTFGSYTILNTEFKQKYFDIYEGNPTLTKSFVKNGYETTNVDIIMLNNQTINQSINITPVNLFIKVYDGDTLAPLTFDLMIENGVITSYTGLTVFNQSYPDIPLGDIKLTASATGYSNGIFYTTMSSDTSLEYNIYLTPENSTSVITFEVKDFSDSSFLENVLIEAQQIINNTKVTVQQTLTAANGLAYLYLDDTKDYEFIFTKDGYVVGNVNAIPGVTTYTIKLKADSTSYEYLDDVSYKILPNTDVIYGGSNVTFQLFISSSAMALSTISIIDNFGNVLYSDSSINPTGTTFSFTKYFLNDTNITKVTMDVSYIVNGNTKSVSREFKVFSLADSGVKNFIDFKGENDEESRLFRFFVIITTFATFIILGSREQTTRDFISLILILPLIIFTYIAWIPLLYATVMFLAMVVFYMGANKR